ncbi:hypothetical protein [Streptomyces longispororuber]|uniref:hypothetical protein n=1 Tax=Streptomyces longispororuber TaxID=68230 RepID=UPI00167DE3B5|nr:hypothetical protein [Streptomyces longispororuber]
MISVDYSQFYVMEMYESEFDELPHMSPDFASHKPVLLTPGTITICSEVHWHYAPVTLLQVPTVDDIPTLGEEWAHLDSVEYRPVYRGTMQLYGCTTGPAEPDVRLQLDPGRTHAVHVYVKGRQDARVRWEEYLDNEFPGEDAYTEGNDPSEDEEDEFRKTVFEEYLIVFSPLGSQAAPQPADRPWRRRF